MVLKGITASNGSSIRGLSLNKVVKDFTTSFALYS